MQVILDRGLGIIFLGLLKFSTLSNSVNYLINFHKQHPSHASSQELRPCHRAGPSARDLAGHPTEAGHRHNWPRPPPPSSVLEPYSLLSLIGPWMLWLLQLKAVLQTHHSGGLPPLNPHQALTTALPCFKAPLCCATFQPPAYYQWIRIPWAGPS